ncbi:hypothetical protein Pla22_29260 [Rubripirellula amarantea]|uniref:Uncharacterized protein n=1 Tax=Rubripirellula amarantea TaxID=2527999 RepID=A0A5C5WJ92_9BACT|nr:hypothetical protein Pla22_29260 [Rubripirellula amarantea]
MNAIEHQECFGTMFPHSIGIGEQSGKVFSVRVDAPAGMMRAHVNTRADIQQWDECRRCPEFESCYQLCMAKIALETAVAASH